MSQNEDTEYSEYDEEQSLSQAKLMSQDKGFALGVSAFLALSCTQILALPFINSGIDIAINSRKDLILTNTIRLGKLYKQASHPFSLAFFGWHYIIPLYGVYGMLKYTIYEWTKNFEFVQQLQTYQTWFAAAFVAEGASTLLVRAPTDSLHQLLTEKVMKPQQDTEKHLRTIKNSIQRLYFNSMDIFLTYFRNKIVQNMLSFSFYEAITNRVYSKRPRESLTWRDRLTVAFSAGFGGGALYAIFYQFFVLNDVTDFMRRQISLRTLFYNFSLNLYAYSNANALQWVLYDTILDQYNQLNNKI